MGKIFFLFVLITPLSFWNTAVLGGQPQFADSLVVHLINPLKIERTDEPIFIKILSIQAKFPHFNSRAYAIFEKGHEIPSQVDDTNRDGTPDLLTFVVSFLPKEKKEIVIRYNPIGMITREYEKRTQADLSIKTDYTFVDGKYTGGKFVDIDSVRVPSVHIDHDALFRHEGPAWESDKVGYRYYLDERNRTDIFGKKVTAMVLNTAGVHDLVANNNESYESMMSWGMDIFKVGTSLGIGSIAMHIGNEIETVSKTDSVCCIIAANGPVRSDVRGMYFGWNVGGKKYNLISDYSITAGSRLTQYHSHIYPDPENLCTGLAKHAHTVFIQSQKNTNEGWQYIGLYGKQSLAGDNLGIAIFYKASDFVRQEEDAVNRLVILRPHDGALTYYFAAAWEQEPRGIKTLTQFRSYLNSVKLKLDSPIEVTY
jgi:Domain of unknown function (DUF4861)